MKPSPVRASALLDFTPAFEARSAPRQDLRHQQRDGSGGARPDQGATMLKEFKDFLFRGNIVELAVAFVMGVAFATVVNSLVENIVMPVIAMIIGRPDFSDLTFTVNDAVFRYGAFITDVIQFVAISAAVFFFIVKPVQMMLARARREPIEEGIARRGAPPSGAARRARSFGHPVAVLTMRGSRLAESSRHPLG
jgi:large conductance mechanosensitive channel